MGVLFLALGLASLTAIFALQNTEAVTVRIVLWEYQTSLVLVILGSWESVLCEPFFRPSDARSR